jgi:hypothetical protein
MFLFEEEFGNIWGSDPSLSGDVVIPSAIGGVPVTALTSGAFMGRNITSIVIPDSVTFISDNVFRDTPLTSISLGNGITYIGWDAFVGTQLTSIVIPDSTTFISNNAFDGVPLTSLILGNSVSYIGDNAFQNTALTSVELPNSLTYLGHSAFLNAPLTSAQLSTNLGFLGTSAFQGTQLTTVEIPSSVSFFGSNAFSDTPLTSVTIGAGVSEIGFEAFAFTKLTEVVFPDGLRKINAWAFAGTPLTSVTFGLGLQEICSGAFENTKLTNVEIPNAVTRIGWGAFKDTPLASVTLGSGLKTIEGEAFRGTKLTTVVIPDSVASIGRHAFADSSDVWSHITVGSGIESMGNHIFATDTGTFNIPVQVRRPESMIGNDWHPLWNAKNIGESDLVSFNHTTSVITFNANDGSQQSAQLITDNGNGISLPENPVAEFGFVQPAQFLGWSTDPNATSGTLSLSDLDSDLTLYAIWNNPIEISVFYFDSSTGEITGVHDFVSGAISIPTAIGGVTVTGIADFAFEFNDKITSVVIPDSVTNLGEGAFYNATALTSVHLGNGITNIWYGTFFNTGLTSIVIPDGVALIGSEAFERTPLTSITFGNGLTTIHSGAFVGTNLTEVVIPDSVISIGSFAFEGISSLTSLILGSGLKTIGGWAFAGCALTSIVIPDSVTLIEQGAFRNNPLTSVTLGLGLEKICGDAFRNNQLTSIVIPDSVKHIGSAAFARNNSTVWTHIVVGSGIEYMCSEIFTNFQSGISDDIPIYMRRPVSKMSDFSRVWSTGWNLESYCDVEHEAFFYDTIHTTYAVTFHANDGSNQTAWRAIEKSDTTVTLPNRADFDFDQPANLIGWSTNPSATSGDMTLPSLTSDIDLYAVWDNPELMLPWAPGHIFHFEAEIGLIFGVDRANLPTELYIPPRINGVPVVAIGDWVFANANITSVVIPSSVEWIGEGAFAETTLTSVTFNEGLDYIGPEAFMDNPGLTHITIPNSVTGIGSEAFQRCTSLASVTFGQGLEFIGSWAFDSTALTSVVIPDSVTTIGNRAFARSSGTWTHITVGSGVQSMGARVFATSSGDSNIPIYMRVPESKMPTNWWDWDAKGLTGFDSYFTIHTTNAVTFHANDGSMHTVWRAIDRELYDGVVALPGRDTFPFLQPADFLGWSTNPTATSGGMTLPYLDDDISVYAIWDNPVAMFPLHAITFDPSSGTIYSSDSSLMGVIEIPSTIDGVPVRHINEHAFMNRGITSLVIPEGVISIGDMAFAFNNNLEHVTLPSTLVTIGENAFVGTGSDNPRTFDSYRPATQTDGWVEGWARIALGGPLADVDYPINFLTLAVTFNPNGADSGATHWVAIDRSTTTVTLPTAADVGFAYAGKKFIGWSTNASATLGNLTLPHLITDPAPLFAIWATIVYCDDCLQDVDYCICVYCDECDKLVDDCICVYCGDCNKLEKDCICVHCDDCNELEGNCICVYCDDCGELEADCVCVFCDDCNELEGDCVCIFCDECGELETNCTCVFCDDCNELEDDCTCVYCDDCNELEDDCVCVTTCKKCNKAEDDCTCDDGFPRWAIILGGCVLISFLVGTMVFVNKRRSASLSSAGSDSVTGNDSDTGDDSTEPQKEMPKDEKSK